MVVDALENYQNADGLQIAVPFAVLPDRAVCVLIQKYIYIYIIGADIVQEVYIYMYILTVICIGTDVVPEVYMCMYMLTFNCIGTFDCITWFMYVCVPIEWKFLFLKLRVDIYLCGQRS